MKRIIYAIILFSAIAVSSCKKDNKLTPNPTGPSKTGSKLDLIKDSVYLYAKETYYWNDQLPDYETLKPRSFTGSNDAEALSNEVDALSQYAINKATGRPYEYYSYAPGTAKYSFIDDGSVSSELNGQKGDFGFSIFYQTDDDLRIKYVYPGSPADKKGIKRGYQIVKINGRTELNYDDGVNFQFVIKAYAQAKDITMTLKKFDGTTYDVNITAAEYTVNPVLATKVFDQGGGKKVGYIVFNTFTSEGNAKPKLDAAFANFKSKGVTDLVVDLRYNGGGVVSTAEYLTDLIAPAAKNGSLMYTTYYNADLQKDVHPLLDKIYDIPAGEFLPTNKENRVLFQKAGSLALKSVIFIVTPSTASASELTINNLLPVMNVKLIGTTTYGKPVGFFGIDINKYELYVPNFETKNSAGKGGYYAGMTPGSSAYPGYEADDDVTKDFGDPTEALLASALSYVKKGTFSVSGPRLQSLSKTLSVEKTRQVAIEIDGKQFKGMIGTNTLKHKR